MADNLLKIGIDRTDTAIVKRYWIAPLLCTALLQACSMGILDKKPENVQFLTRLDPRLEGCKRLGPISATGSGYYNMETGLSDASNHLRASAAQLGGDAVVINTREGDDNFYTKVHAVAYKCSLF